MPFEMKLTGNEKQDILDKLGDRIEQMHPLGPRCVVAVYQRAAKLASGLRLPDSVVDADRAQGKVGLLIRKGSTAFKEDDSHSWGGNPPMIKDWVAYRVGDTAQMECGDVRLRVIEDVDIIMVLDRPDAVY